VNILPDSRSFVGFGGSIGAVSNKIKILCRLKSRISPDVVNVLRNYIESFSNNGCEQMIRSLILIFLVGILSACSKSSPSDNSTESAENYKHVSAQDIGINTAITTAKRTSNNFFQAFCHPKPSFHKFSVKKLYPAKYGSSEAIWIGELKQVGDHLEGRITNTPFDTTEVKFDQTVTVKVSEIVDWMYLDGNNLIGGYTIRFFYDQMSEHEKKRFLNQNGYVIK
jgi:uncharacterized protein YegJ (DUF2314 family)